MRLTIKNYRCFSDEHPVYLNLGQEAIAIIGSNNSGKSALLRFLYEFRPTFNLLAEPENIVGVMTQPPTVALQILGAASDNVFCLQNSRPLQFKLNIDLPSGSGASRPNCIIVTAARSLHNHISIELFHDRQPLSLNMMGYYDDHVISPFPSDFRATLKPIGDSLKELGQAKYVGAERTLISQTTGAHYDLRMGTELVSTWKQMKFGGHRRSSDQCRSLESRICRAFGFESFEIRVHASDTMLQLKIDNAEFLLNEVGSGLAQYILVGANLLIYPCTFALIDEPESNLHAGIQSDFLEMIEEYSKSGVIFASHSLGLATSFASETHVTERIQNGTTIVRKLANLSPRASFLTSLVYSGFIDVGARTVVMVEGQHDVNPTKVFLRTLHLRQFGAVLAMHGDSSIGGNAEDYLDEYLKLVHCNQIIFIIDSERISEGAELHPTRAAFERLCADRGIACLVTERRAFENYFTDAAVKKTKGASNRALAPYELLDPKAVDLWGKPENGTIAAAMTADEILDTDLGKFLKEHVRSTDA